MANNTSKNLNEQKPSFVSAPPKPAKKETRPFCIPSKISTFLPWCYALLFAVLAAYYLIGLNSDTLYMVQGRNLFQSGMDYFNSCLDRSPGGFLFWAGTYLTQYFYNPTVGASMLIALWIATFVATKYAFNMKGAWTILAIVPLVCLLCSDILTGYWIYYLKHPGYYFTSSIGLFITMVAILIGRILPEKLKLVWLAVWGIASYCFIGWFTLIGTVYMCTNFILNDKKMKMNTYLILGTSAAILIIVPLAFHQIYPNCPLNEAWSAVFPIFWAGDDKSHISEVPFYVMAVIPLFFTFVGKKNEKDDAICGKDAYGAVLCTIAIIAGSVYITDKVNFDDYNYHAEMRMYRAIEEQRWNDVLSEMTQIPGDATREMVLFKNIALANTGHLGDALCRYNNMGQAPYAYDSLKIHMVQTAAPIIYYYHGKLNFCTRWCIENSVEYGYKIHDLQNLTRCAIINEEWDVARKYVEILKKTTFHKEWAEHYEPLLKNPKLITDYHEFDNVRDLYSHMGTTLDGDNGLCEMYLLNYFSNTMNKDSKYLQEMTLAYALIQKDIQLFWPRFFLYANLHKGEPMPIHYQEAAYLYGTLEPQNVDIRTLPFDREKVIDRYAGFQSLSQKLMNEQKQFNGEVDVKKVGELMKAAYGDTFYWFYFFCRDVKSY